MSSEIISSQVAAIGEQWAQLSAQLSTQLASIKLPPLPPFLAMPTQPLSKEEAKLATAAALGVAATGAVFLLSRRGDRSSAAPEFEITTLEDLQAYRTGGLLRDVAAWAITPRVTAVRVTGHGARIPSLPRGLCNLSLLRELKVSENAIVELPRDISRLTGLEALDVGDNRLRALPDGIGALTRLTSLNAMGTQLDELPARLGALPAGAPPPPPPRSQAAPLALTSPL